MSLDSIEDAVRDIRDGKMVIVVDEEDRENEGDLTMAAEKATPEAINFMASHGRGLICLSMAPDRLDALEIPLMMARNQPVDGTAFCVTIEGRRGITTGTSAFDRATTILMATDESCGPDDFMMPGHVFPLRARRGGVLERPGQTEAAVDLARLADLKPSGVICEVMSDDGTMARLPELQAFARRHDLRIISVVDLITYRMRTERFLRPLEPVPFECEHGAFTLRRYDNEWNGQQHLVFVKGDLGGLEPPLVRVHSSAVPDDVVLGTRSIACCELRRGLRAIERQGRGAVLHLRAYRNGKAPAAPGRDGTDVAPDVAPADAPASTPPMSFRDIGVGARILSDLELGRIRLLARHPAELADSTGLDVEIAERVPLD